MLPVLQHQEAVVCCTYLHRHRTTRAELTYCSCPKQQVADRLASALHAAPWSLRLRAALATALLDIGPLAAPKAARLCAPAPQPASTGDAAADDAHRLMLRARGSGALAAGAGVASVAAELRVHLQSSCRCVLTNC